MKKALAFLMAAVMLMSMLTACGNKDNADNKDNNDVNTEETDKAAADKVAALIDAIYVQERTEETDAQCEAAKAAWDALTDAQKALVEGEEASPDYFGLDTGDASKDDPRNQDEIGEKELLVVSFGTSFNDSRVADIKSIEDALQEANPDWSVRRAFTAQIIINHIQARDGEKIDNMEQALERAVANGVKQLVVQPTHLMHGAEYDEMCAAIDKVRDQFDSVEIAEPLLGEVGDDATVINADKEAVAKAVVAAALEESGYETTAAAKDAGVAYVLSTTRCAPPSTRFATSLTPLRSPSPCWVRLATMPPLSTPTRKPLLRPLWPLPSRRAAMRPPLPPRMPVLPMC